MVLFLVSMMQETVCAHILTQAMESISSMKDLNSFIKTRGTTINIDCCELLKIKINYSFLYLLPIIDLIASWLFEILSRAT